MIRRPSFSALTIAVLAIALAAVLAGCSAAPASSSQPASSSAPTAAPSAATGPTIKVLSPLAGATVTGSELSVRVETTGLKFVEPSTTLVPGEGHVHFTLDDRPVAMSAAPDYVFKDLAPGPHTLRSELVQNDATPLVPAVFQTVTFTVK